LNKQLNKYYHNFLNFLDTLKAVLFDMFDEGRAIGKIKVDIEESIKSIKESVKDDTIRVDLLKKSLMTLVNSIKRYLPIMNQVDLEELPSFPIKNDRKIIEVINKIDMMIDSELELKFKNTVEAFAEEIEIELSELDK